MSHGAQRPDRMEFIKVDGGPHILPWIYPEVVNPALLRFCGQ